MLLKPITFYGNKPIPGQIKDKVKTTQVLVNLHHYKLHQLSNLLTKKKSTVRAVLIYTKEV